MYKHCMSKTAKEIVKAIPEYMKKHSKVYSEIFENSTNKLIMNSNNFIVKESYNIKKTKQT